METEYTQLPTELLFEILRQSEGRSLYRFCQVNKQLLTLCHNDPIIKEKMLEYLAMEVALNIKKKHGVGFHFKKTDDLSIVFSPLEHRKNTSAQKISVFFNNNNNTYSNKNK